MKIKVVLLCHFSCAEVREKLPLSSLSFQNYFNFFLHRKKLEYIDYGGWNINIINALKTRGDIDLYVIAPHYGLCNRYTHYENEGVSYYFYRPELLFPFNYLIKIVKRKRRNTFRSVRKTVAGFIKEIKPDIVNLVGAENPYYSITALDIDNIPIILHCQTVYANPDRIKRTNGINQLQWDTELRLFHHIPYIACTGRMYYDLIKGYEPNAIIFPRVWPASKFPEIENVPKHFDFVYFARYLNRNKGFDNAIEAMGIACKKHPELKFLAVGNFDGEKETFEKRIKEIGIENNLTIHPSFEEYTEMLQYVKQSRFALLPIKMDVISGTILEAMQMGLPVVTCRTSGTPSLNSKRECVLISDIGDNETLALNMIHLYESPKLEETLRQNSFMFISEEAEKNNRNVDLMVTQYHAVMDHYHHGTPIPKDLLFNTENTTI